MHERRAGLEHAVDLAQGAAEVVLVVEGVAGDDDVDRAAGREAEVGQLAVVALDGDAAVAAAAARRSAMRSGSGSRAIALAPAAGEGDAVAGDPELDHPAAAVTSPISRSSSSPGMPAP